MSAEETRPDPADADRAKRRYRSPRRARQAAETRAAILVAATRLFGEHGWTGTTMAEVARCAETAVETIYAGFGSKVGLLEAAIDVAIVGDDQDLPLAERPAYGLAAGTRAERIAVGADLITDTHRAAPLMRALRQAAVDDAQLAQRWSNYESRRRDEHARALRIVAGKPVSETLIDTMWAVASTEIYDKLTLERSWTPPRYRDWITQTLHALLP